MFRKQTIVVWIVFVLLACQWARAQTGVDATSPALAAHALTALMTAQERMAFEQLRANAGPTGRAAIDLTDPVQRQAYYALLRLHGITRESRPHLFAGFDRAIDTQGREAADGLPVRVSDCRLPVQAADGARMSDFRDILDIDASPDFKTVSARALDTVVDPATYVLDFVDVYDEKWEKVLSSATDEGFTKATAGCTDGKCLDPHLQILQT